jgi:hypothetical protein
MTAAEFHQQQLEQQEQEYLDLRRALQDNHSKFIAVAYTIRDTKQDPSYVKSCVKYLLEALEDYEQLRRMM